MNEIDVLEAFIDEIESLGYKVETAYSYEDLEKEVVVIDSWGSRRVQRTNTTYHSDKKDADGNSTGERHHFYKNMDLELEVHSENELHSLEVQNAIRKHFRKYESDPIAFNSDMVSFSVGSGGKRKPLIDPTSSRIYKATQNFSLEFVDEEVLNEEIDQITEIQKNYDIN